MHLVSIHSNLLFYTPAAAFCLLSLFLLSVCYDAMDKQIEISNNCKLLQCMLRKSWYYFSAIHLKTMHPPITQKVMRMPSIYGT